MRAEITTAARAVPTIPTVLTVLTVLAMLTATSSATGAQLKKPPKTVTLSGCIETDGKTPDRYMLTDTMGGLKYHLTGKDFREYLGRPIQVDGGVVVKGLKISGGLQPSANVAAQAGAIDPSRAVVQAATSESGTGTPVDVQDFRVKTIRQAAGSCR
jgi:hypothetical protein